MDPIAISISPFGIEIYTAIFTLAIVGAIFGLVFGIIRITGDAQDRRNSILGFLVLLISIGVAFGNSAAYTANQKAHRDSQINRIENSLSKDLGIPVSIAGEDIWKLVDNPQSLGFSRALKLSYELDGETYWLALEARQRDPKGGNYIFELYRAGEPLPIEDYVESIDYPPLTPEGLLPADPEDAR